MSIKDYPTEELLAELAARVRTDSPLYDPQELRDMLIKSESECAELRAQVERLRRLAKSINSDCNSLRAEVRELRRHLGKTMSERDGLQASRELLATERDCEAERANALQARVAQLEKDLAAWRDAAIAESRGRDVSDVDWVLRAHAAEDKLQALQARIDAGVRVYRTSNEEWMERKYAGSGASGLLIDIEYMHPDDDRNGEADRNTYRTTDLDAALTLDIESIERKKRADGSTTPRTGERRKGLEEQLSRSGKKRFLYQEHNFYLNQPDRRDPSGANERRKSNGMA